MKPMILVGFNTNTSISKTASAQYEMYKEVQGNVHRKKKLKLPTNRRKAA